MMSEAALDSPAPSPYCTATTKEGKPCRAMAVNGGELCRAHSMTPEQLREMRERASEARRERAQARRDAVESSRLGLQALLGVRLEERADAIASRLERLALSEDDATARDGIRLWLERVYGRPVQPTEDLTPQTTELPLDDEARAQIIRLLPPQ